jgi:cell division protein FtsQ
MERSIALPIARPLRIPSGVSSALALIWRGKRMRIALVALLIALPVLGGGYVLLRHSSFVAVQHVQVSGVHGAEAPAIEAALRSAARHMSTLDVRAGALREAVAQFPVVSAVRATASFPHGLRIEVSEQLPVATLLANGARTAVAANGVILGPALLSSALPTLGGYVIPAVGERLHDVTLRECLTLLGAAPRPFARHIARVYSGPEGITVAMRNGLVVYFGEAVRPHAKWLSLARVLADHSSAGASYVDVRLPARPAAGFPAGAGPSSSSASTELSSTVSTGSSESTVGALAEGLSKEGGASSSTSSKEPSPSTTEPSASGGESSSSGSSEASSSEAREAESAPHGEASQEAPAAGG